MKIDILIFFHFDNVTEFIFYIYNIIFNLDKRNFSYYQKNYLGHFNEIFPSSSRV